jgi:hypothetical protein
MISNGFWDMKLLKLLIVITAVQNSSEVKCVFSIHAGFGLKHLGFRIQALIIFIVIFRARYRYRKNRAGNAGALSVAHGDSRGIRCKKTSQPPKRGVSIHSHCVSYGIYPIIPSASALGYG